MRYRLITITLSLFLFTFLTLTFALSWQPLLAEETALHGPQCIRSGPSSLPANDDYCGCTWGPVYYRGKPVAQALVTLEFNGKQLTQNTYQIEGDDFPYFDTSAYTLGARLNSILTVTTRFADETVTRTFRARPGDERTQEVALVIPEVGVWHSLVTGNYTETLLIQDNMLWAGGKGGLLSLNLLSKLSTTHSLPWPTQSVVALTAADNGHLWAAGAHHLAEYDGANWNDRSAPLPFGATIRTLIVDPTTNALWLGGGDNGSALAVYDGSWHTVNAITVSGRIEAITVDFSGDVWVGSRKGLYRHPHNSPAFDSDWTTYQVEDGLGSNDVRSLASDTQYLWIGGAPYDGDTALPKGGISRYNLSDGSWQTFTTTHGLPADLEGAAGLIASLTVDGNGRVWAGTTDGLYFLATESQWINDSALADQPVMALASKGETLLLARGTGIETLNRSQQPGTPPIVQINTPPLTLAITATLTLSATAHDTDEVTSQIIGWDWVSNRAGALCTTADVCTIPASVLGVGIHEVSLRVQDDEGVWSTPVKTMVTINGETASQQVFLPLVNR